MQKGIVMHDVMCPECEEIRQVKAKKPWMKGEPPYGKICKVCCQLGKEKTEEHKQKLSESVKALQTEKVLERKSEFMKAHPEIWQENIRTEGCTFSHSEETKEKIGKGVKKAWERKKDDK